MAEIAPQRSSLEWINSLPGGDSSSPPYGLFRPKSQPQDNQKEKAFLTFRSQVYSSPPSSLAAEGCSIFTTSPCMLITILNPSIPK